MTDTPTTKRVWQGPLFDKGCAFCGDPGTYYSRGDMLMKCTRCWREDDEWRHICSRCSVNEDVDVDYCLACVESGHG